MGRHHEARATLEVAVSAFGRTNVLEAARSHIMSGVPFADSASLTTDDETMERIRFALLDLLQLDRSSRPEHCSRRQITSMHG